MKINLGCGTDIKEGWVNVDRRQFVPGIEIVDLTRSWPWEDSSVEEAYCSHMIEHLTAPERIHFINELYRVMAPGAKCTLIAPHWSSKRAYGDLTHQWPPVSEFWFHYLVKEWREQNAPHSAYNDEVNFESTWGYSVIDVIMTQPAEVQEAAKTFYKDAIEDIYVTMVKK